MANVNYSGEMLRDFGINATADYSGSDSHGTFQFRFLQLDTANAGNVILPAGAGQAVIGVMQNAPRLNESAQFAFIGATKVQLGGTVTVGELLMTDANGNAVAYSAATGNVAVGYSKGAGVVGDILTMILLPNTYPHP
jgi:hypothetical protein